MTRKQQLGSTQGRGLISFVYQPLIECWVLRALLINSSHLFHPLMCKLGTAQQGQHVSAQHGIV